MSGEVLIPVDAPGEHDDVADLLSIARVTWNRGDHAAAVSFVQRAAQAAMELELEMRGIELAKAAADLKATLSVAAGPTAAQRPSTLTPPLVLTPRPPDAGGPASAEPETVRSDEAAPTVRKQRNTDPGLGLLTAEDEVDVDSARDWPSVQNLPAAPAPSPKAPRVAAPSGASPVAPRASASMAARPQASPSPPRTSNNPPPLPARAHSGSPPTSGAAPARRPTIPPNGSPIPPKVAHSPIPPKVAPTTSARPATSLGPMPSRGPQPLRVQTNVPPNMVPPPAPAPSPAPPPVVGAIIPPAVEPQNVRKSAPWVDEVIGPIATGGGQPVVVGLKARVHFRTDGSLEIGPDIEAAGGLPVVVLPQRGEDMVMLLKRLKR